MPVHTKVKSVKVVNGVRITQCNPQKKRKVHGRDPMRAPEMEAPVIGYRRDEGQSYPSKGV